jgi:putative addiction module component (TIGR02574 family)
MMNDPLERLFAEALQLPSRDRAVLATRLIASLDDEDEPGDEVERAWEEEIRRRVAEIDAGTEMIPAEEVFAEARSRLRPGPPAVDEP